mgnify:CR=1 FL=1
MYVIIQEFPSRYDNPPVRTSHAGTDTRRGTRNRAARIAKRFPAAKFYVCDTQFVEMPDLGMPPSWVLELFPMDLLWWDVARSKLQHRPLDTPDP